MKLTQLYIHNYKSFYDTTIVLDKMNIIVGENNSGKSNLVDVLEFIDIAMAKDIEKAISEKGGYDNIKNYNAIGEKKVIIKATFTDVNLEYTSTSSKFRTSVKQKEDFTYSIAFSSTYSLFSIHKNYEIQYMENNNSLSLEDEVLTLFNSPKENVNFIISIKKYFKEKKSKSKIFIKSKNHKPFIKEVLKGTYFFEHYQSKTLIYYFNSQLIRDKSDKENNSLKLLKDGFNLGQVLFSMDKNQLNIISNSLITTVNEIEGIEVKEVFGNYLIGFQEKQKKPISIQKVSDGTINFLATMTALNQELSDTSLLVFEEPERHLHLNAITYMLEAFRDNEKQVLITTHSTEILKHAHIEEIVFIYRDSDGDTESIRADAIPNLKRKMKRLGYKRDIRLDELIAEGMIGTFE